jgi:hypothetical protein
MFSFGWVLAAVRGDRAPETTMASAAAIVVLRGFILVLGRGLLIPSRGVRGRGAAAVST